MTISNQVNNGFDAPASGSKDNALYLNGAYVPVRTALAITAGSTNIAEVAVNFEAKDGETLTGVHNFDIWLSDAATGAGLTATSASGTVQAKSASGVDLEVMTAKKAIRAQTLATGVYTLEITDSAKTGFYVCVQNPFTGATEVSDQLVTASYG